MSKTLINEGKSKKRGRRGRYVSKIEKNMYIDTIIKRYEQGIDTAAIAKRLDLAVNTVRRWLVKEGVYTGKGGNY